MAARRLMLRAYKRSSRTPLLLPRCTSTLAGTTGRMMYTITPSWQVRGSWPTDQGRADSRTRPHCISSRVRLAKSLTRVWASYLMPTRFFVPTTRRRHV
eukprot:scaffold300753_cov28-Tisochrysis_lutea.AAC.3